MRYGHLLQIGLFLAFLFTGLASMLAFGGKETVSETENRALAAIPRYSFSEIKSGVYFRSLENYWADHVAFRDALVEAGKKVTAWQGIAGEERAVLIASQANNTGASDSAAPKPQGNSPVFVPSEAPPTPAEPPREASAAQAPSQSAVREEKGRVIGKVLAWGTGQ